MLLPVTEQENPNTARIDDELLTLLKRVADGESFLRPANESEDELKSFTSQANALLARTHERPLPPENPMSADRVRWEHIQRVYELCGQNVSETARRLNMHRRTLQRILAKRSPK